MAALFAAPLFRLPPLFFPLEMFRRPHALAETVFSGSKIEEFQVEILGVWRIWTQGSIILAKLSGGPLAKTGVMQG